MLDESRFTICTISFGHADYLALNWQISERLNGLHWKHVDWLIAENAPTGTLNRVSSDLNGFKIRSVVSDTARGPSYHHAIALNSLLSEVQTRFIFVIDPDFFLLRPNWLVDIQRHMDSNGLGFFGVPWHPRYTENYRYFPAVHCMVIDQSLVPLKEVDFCPLLEELDSKNINKKLPLSWIEKFLCAGGLHHRHRKSWDTGTRVFQRFGKSSQIRSECVMPVFRLSKEGNGNSLKIKSRLLEWFLPDNFCYLPKRRNSYTELGFFERGWSNVELPMLWEEHIWKEAPFGLHIRRSYANNQRDNQNEFAQCQNFIDNYFSVVLNKLKPFKSIAIG